MIVCKATTYGKKRVFKEWKNSKNIIKMESEGGGKRIEIKEEKKCGKCKGSVNQTNDWKIIRNIANGWASHKI